MDFSDQTNKHYKKSETEKDLKIFFLDSIKSTENEGRNPHQSRLLELKKV
jgi:hypothetical protein